MVSVIAHRGLRNEQPENTLKAIQAALEVPGLKGVEFDVELTQDGGLVVLHQETLMPNREGTALEMAVRNHTSRDWVRGKTTQEVRSLDAGSWMGAEFRGSNVPALQEVLALSWGTKTAYVELKDATYWGVRDTGRAKEVVDAAIRDCGSFTGSLAVVSFNPEILRLFSKGMPRVPTTLALWVEWRGQERQAIEQAMRCGARTVSIPYQMALESSLWTRVARDNALEVHAYPLSPVQGEAACAEWSAEVQKSTWSALADAGVSCIVSDFARDTVNLFQ